MKQLAQAIINVMKDVKNIEKSMTVGTGQSSYKGVADKDVKHIVGEAMAKHGLCILPTKIESSVKVERWETTYNGQVQMKQSVFTDVKTEYLLLHESGEMTTISGYGHGIDSQDKSAGKATTYALKYALLYLFMIPTGTIDDADKDHSDNKEVPRFVDTTSDEAKADKPWLNKFSNKEKTHLSEAFEKAVEFVKGGGKITDIEKKYKLSGEVKKELQAAL